MSRAWFGVNLTSFLWRDDRKPTIVFKNGTVPRDIRLKQERKIARRKRNELTVTYDVLVTWS